MKRFIPIILIFLLITITLSNIIVFNKNNGKLLNNTDKNDSNFISMMLENDNGEYEERTDITFPKEDYIFNSEKSGCENGGTLIWNKEKGKIEASLVTSDKCYAYFDKYDFTKSCMFGYEDNFACELIKNKDNTLIYHDGKCDYEGEENCDLEAGDNNYRYAGAEADVHNYVCFGNDDATCPEDNLYRIIGIFNGNIKLIKADKATTKELGTEGSYSGSDNKYAKGNLNDDDNKWQESLLNKDNLNGFYLYTYLNSFWQNLIVKSTWFVDNLAYRIITYQNVKVAYDLEIANATEKYENTKIGLMYISDFGYAMQPAYWDNRLGQREIDENNYGTYSQYDWLNAVGYDEWLLSSDPTNSYRHYASGTLGTGSSNRINYIRPVFYLEKNIKKIKGTGLINDPYQITL